MSLSYSASVWLIISIYLVYCYLVSVFVYEVIRKNIIGVERVVNIGLTALADGFIVIVWV